MAVFRDGEPVSLPQSKKTRALLGYLLLNPGPHRRDRLCELFWELPDDPRGSLRWSLSKLRPVLNEEGNERLKADRDHVEIDANEIDIDVAQIEHATGDILSVESGALADLADRFNGDLMEGLDLGGQPDFQSWRLASQEEARERHRKVLSALIDRQEDEPLLQVARLRELIHIDPYNGEAHIRLIEAFARSGRTKEAQTQKALSEKLLAEVGDDRVDRLEAALRTAPQQKKSDDTARKQVVRHAGGAAFHQEIRFCRAHDQLQLAYATVGEGPPIVKTANWMNHLEFDWESPVWRHVFRSLSDGRQLVRYDARGNGLSDWDTTDFSFDTMVSDLESVVDALQLKRFPLFGLSQGCAVSIEYAARHPERVSKLILVGGYGRGRNFSSSDKVREISNALETLMRTSWGANDPTFRQVFTSMLMPDAPAENQDWFNELQHMTTRPENAANLYRALADVNVMHRLETLDVPTLVIHARDDQMSPLKLGRELATSIPGARFLTLDTRNHLLPETDPAWARFVSEVELFLAE